MTIEVHPPPHVHGLTWLYLAVFFFAFAGAVIGSMAAAGAFN